MTGTWHAPISAARVSGSAALIIICCAPPAVQGDEPVTRPLQRSVPGAARPEPPAAPRTVPGTRATAAETEAPRSQEHPLKAAIRLAEASLESLEPVRDYEATLTKRELVGNQSVEHAMQIRFREEPFSVYLKFVDANAGREVMYVEGQYQNKILAHEGPGSLKSLVGTVALSPESEEVRSESRHSITDIGLRNMLKIIIGRWEEESKYGECEVQYYPRAKLDQRECLVIECRHPRPRKQFKFHISRLFIDRETNLPVRSENYGFPTQPNAKPPLLEEYTYSGLRTNVQLTDRDFDRNNPEYKF
jgi:hypothetical protein